MADIADKKRQDDEVILYVPYTNFTSWLVGIISIFLGPVYYYGAYVLLQRGDYVAAAIVVFGGLVLLANGIEVHFSEHILFYRARLTKVWYGLGTRTIPYSRAKLIVPPAWQRWVGKGFRIKETDHRGRVPHLQIPIMYMPRYTSKKAVNKAEAVMAFLVGAEGSSGMYEESRVFEKSTLFKELIQEKACNSVSQKVHHEQR